MNQKFLVIVDMQNDFISGALGSDRAKKIVPNIVKKIREYDGSHIYVTRDIHTEDYTNTLEGIMLPVEHCLKDSKGAEIEQTIWKELMKHKNIHYVFKHTFGSVGLMNMLRRFVKTGDEIEIIGVCTDICVVSNALMIRAALPNIRITVDASCCAGTSKKNHISALRVLKSCQIEIKHNKTDNNDNMEEVNND